MAKWKNFHVWRGRLPHWRAENVTYYATFRHKRDLTEDERNALLRRLLSTDGRKLDFLVLCVLPASTEMLFTVQDSPKGEKYELSDVLEKAKNKAGKDIIKSSGERWPPFYSESYDRIVRDDQELEDTFLRIVESPPVPNPEDWPDLYIPTG